MLLWCEAAASRGLLPNIPLFHRQTSSSSMGDNLPSIGPVRRPSHSVRSSAGGGGGGQGPSRPSNPAARRRWRKIRFAIAFISKASAARPRRILSQLIPSTFQHCLNLNGHLHTHTHTHPFNGPLSGTTQVSRYQKGKTNLDFTEARDSEWQ